jgi:hypothetical protein
LVFEEERDADLGEGEVGDDHDGEDGEERSRQWLEAEQVGDWRDVGDCDAEGGAAKGGDEEGSAGAALEEGDAAGADDEDDERLGGERFDEPARLEQAWAGVEDAQHDGEGEEVVDARDRAEEGHEAADHADVPLGRAGE